MPKLELNHDSISLRLAGSRLTVPQHYLEILHFCHLISSTGIQVLTMKKQLIVQTKEGPVQGKEIRSEETGEKYCSFQGIPYAHPPVGPLRFKVSHQMFCCLCFMAFYMKSLCFACLASRTGETLD